MMLYFARGLYVYQRDQQAGAWVRDLSHARLLKGETLCVLGLGDIGRQVVARARAFEMRIIGVREILPRSKGLNGSSLWTFGRGAAGDDHLAITLPLTRETRGIIDARRLRLLPKGAFLYNIGRGAVVDEDALVEALRSGHLGGAGLDVFVEEPLPADHPLWSMENVIITPHLGADTPWDYDNAAELFVENFRRFMSGESLVNEIDIEAVDFTCGDTGAQRLSPKRNSDERALDMEGSYVEPPRRSLLGLDAPDVGLVSCERKVVAVIRRSPGHVCAWTFRRRASMPLKRTTTGERPPFTTSPPIANWPKPKDFTRESACPRRSPWGVSPLPFGCDFRFADPAPGERRRGRQRRSGTRPRGGESAPRRTSRDGRPGGRVFRSTIPRSLRMCDGPRMRGCT